MHGPSLRYCLAASADEFEQVFRLNHATFTSEIPQHAARASGRLVDRFHDQNEYLICKHGDEVIGMLALRAQRPFSLDQKLPELDAYLPPARRVCEVRLLAVKGEWRHSRVFAGLARALAQRCAQRQLDYAIISATTRQLKLYGHMGFKPFGPLTGSGEAMFQPMALALEEFNASVVWLAAQPAPAVHPPHTAQAAQAAQTAQPHTLPTMARAREAGDLPAQILRPVLLTPGPVEMHADVRAALALPPQPHRSEDVMASLARCQAALCALTGADAAHILLGSGTLANDAIAQQLRAHGPGLVLANGEFGERLIDHCARAGLDVQTHCVAWGKAFDFARIEAALRGTPKGTTQGTPAWIWMTACETSTGMRNDISACDALARRLGAALVLDCISALGNQPLDLRGVLLASGVSGKGVGAPAGLSFVLHRHGALRAVPGVPRILDVWFAAQRGGMPFTQSSNLLAALERALALMTPAHFARIATATAAVHRAFSEAGAAVVVDGTAAAAGVITIALPHGLTAAPPAAQLGRALLQQGFHIAFESAYLRERNWVQLAWMGQVEDALLLAAIAAMRIEMANVTQQSYFKKSL